MGGTELKRNSTLSRYGGYAAPALAWALASAPGHADVKSTVNTAYYSVSGQNALEIYRSLVTRGPHVGDTLAYATTTARTEQKALFRTGRTCSFAAYRLSVSFSTKLPRLASEAALAGGDRERWRSFATFVQRHEATHRTIWLGCSADLQTQIINLSAPDCAGLARKALAIAEQVGKACTRRHQAFDAAQQLLLKQQTFIQSVFRQAAR